MKNTTLLILLLLSLGIPDRSYGQEPVRKGFLAGAAVGGTFLRLNGDPARSGNHFGPMAPNLKLGTTIGPRAALLLYLPGTVYRLEDPVRPRDRGFEAILPSIQYWPLSRVWVLGGVGMGMDAPAFYDIRNEDDRRFHFGYAVTLAGGYEFLRRGNFTLDIQGRLHAGGIQVSGQKLSGWGASLAIGANLY